MSQLNFIDLCAGTGAFSLAFKQASGHKDIQFKCVFANDMIPESQAIYNLNFHTGEDGQENKETTSPFVLGNLHDIDVKNIPTHDILTAGFPCQAFSQAGKKLGFKDERSQIFWKIVDILKHHKPQYIILENVKNLKTHDKGKTFKIISENLSKCGYHIKHAILDTAKVTNIPQHRERIYIMGFRNEAEFQEFSFENIITASGENDQKTRSQLMDMLQQPIDEIPDKYYYTNRFKVFSAIKEAVTTHVSENAIYQYRRKYVRQNKSNLCPTLTRNSGSGGHNVPLILDDRGIRKLTPRECFNLQGFPSDYKFPPKLSDGRLYGLAGNAVTVRVVKLIVNELARAIKSTHQDDPQI